MPHIVIEYSDELDAAVRKTNLLREVRQAVVDSALFSPDAVKARMVGYAKADVVLEDGFLDEVKRKSLAFKQGLAGIIDEFSGVFEEVRGIGLLLGLKCRMPNAAVNAAFRANNFLAVPAGDNVVRLLPPLNVTDEEIRIALDAIRAGAKSLSSAAGAA